MDRVAHCYNCDIAFRCKGELNGKALWRGNPQAIVMLIGEAPGAEEEETGVPFIGAAGKFLDSVLLQVGLDPEKDVYITNLIKCRPPQ